MSNGFGFSFPSDGRDDDDDNRRDGDNPFGAFGFNFGGQQGGGFGDILNQFGQMLSGMGDSMNSAEAGAAVNYDMATRTARQHIGKQNSISEGDRNAVEESVRLADLWLNDATTLPTSEGRIEAWNAEDWLENTMAMWKRLVSPVAEQMNRAQLDSMPAEAREMLGPMAQMFNQINSMQFGLQLGHALGDLSVQSLTGSDFGLPVAPAGTTAILPGNIAKISRDLNVPGQEVLVYIAARETARQRLFKHVPWLVERLVSSVEEYAAGLEIDTSHLEEAARGLDLESNDPAAIQDAIQQMQGMDLSPRIRSRNAGATARMETLLALVEGWVDLVVTESLKERFPSEVAMTEAWRRRRATGGSAEQAFAKVVGIEFATPRVDKATDLWTRVTNAVGIERRDKVWDHPDFLPTAEHLENPAAFIDALLDDAPDTKFDEEIAKLEEMLRNEPSTEEREEGDGLDDGRDDGTEL
ncbi:zinc-dependent metalloprotease [Corynebacterium breve]|uniref:Zinc-dependent metalloprotease n=1 Tax=Corynebacterium breve TaxID=3049799 RepID=A0ABY8VFQ2_9CORY|nr:zinc-dependent metalloprotease [Corynebacterium breve]WIM68309.1 zinc-dependent metalloprotease [Corynebacterium breve]